MTLLNDRFEIVAQIGRGSQAITHRALDHQTGEHVAIKELDFRRVDDWKAQELFEREGATLRSLNHQSIPSYVDAFSVETDDTIQLFLVQEFIEGETLQDELDRGKRWTEEDAIDDALQLLDALHYLHHLLPPVIHRDIKPSNIIRRTDGRLALVDFGAVQNIVQRTVGGSTIIGTPGYMPIEQLMGRAEAGTDLYALGATIIHLVTGTAPADLPVSRNQLQFRDRAPALSGSFADTLECLTEPNVEDRFASAAEAREELLDFHDELEPLPTSPVSEPADEPTGDSADMSFVPTPGWATASPTEDGQLIEFEARNARNRLVYASIEDRASSVVLHVRTESTPKGLGQLAAVLVLVFVLGGLPILPLLVLALAIAAGVRHTAAGGLSTQLHFEVNDDLYAVDVGRNVVRGATADLLGAAVVDHALVLRRHNAPDLTLLKLDEGEDFRSDWLVSYFDRRIAELNGESKIVTEQDDSRVEFWLEEPVNAK